MHTTTLLFRHRPIFRLVVTVIAAVTLAGCGKSEEQKAREQMAEEEIRHRETAGPPLSDMVLDTLRAMSGRYDVTRDEYWPGKGGVVANQFVEVWYPPGKTTVTQGIFTLARLEDARKKTGRYFGRSPEGPLKAVCEMTMESYNQVTGLEWWVYYKLEGDEIHFQPVDILFSRKLLDIAVARGYYEWSIGEMTRGEAPLWLKNGLASLLSDEDWLLENQLHEFPGDPIKMTVEEIEGALRRHDSKKQYRIAVYNAFRMVRKLVAGSGRERMVEAVRLMGEGNDLPQAVEAAWGKPYEEVVETALSFKVNR
jgi:hypothetical protein